MVRRTTSWLREGSAAALLLAAYYVTGRLGLTIQGVVGGFATLVWVPAGIAMAALLLKGNRLWPGVFGGALLVNLSQGASLPAALGIGAGNTAEALLGSAALARILGHGVSLARLKDAFAFAATTLVCAAVAASAGVLSLWLENRGPASEAAATWIAWWLGDLLSLWVVTPFILSWARRGYRRASFTPLASEALVLLATLVLVCLAIFLGELGRFSYGITLTYLVFPPVIWAALRFGPRGAAAATLIVASHAIGGALLGRGPFVGGPPAENLSFIALYLGVTALTGMLLAAAAAEREDLMRKKDLFIATASHELRTPMSTILGWTDLIGTGRLDPARVRNGLEAIARSARAQEGLVNELLDYSRIQAGKLTLSMQDIDPVDAARMAVEAALPLAAKRSVRIETDLGPQAGTFAADPARLQQILGNLLTNAVKFSAAGGRVLLRAMRDERSVTFQVRDEGIGIPASFLPHVFERFSQAAVPEGHANPGLGLGLAIIRDLVKLHGGEVKAESAGENQGATFTVVMPVRSGSEA